MSNEDHLWVQTPLVHSSHISDRLGCSVYLKLESLQPSQSFKYRGISLLVQQCKADFGPSVHILAASSGNAGLATAVAARRLGIKCTIYLPVVARQDTQRRLRKEGVEVVTVGQIYADSVVAMHAAAKDDPCAVIVPSYEHPVLWEGHSSMVKETKNQLLQKPDAILCSVGGGGLIGGVLVGCKTMGWEDVSIVALETHGANCFYQAISLNTRDFTSNTAAPPAEIPADAPYTIEVDTEHDVAIPYLRKVNSRAVSLGATYAAPAVVRMALDHAGGVRCVSIPDKIAMRSAQMFADEHKMLIELACSTTMSVAYHPDVFWHMLDPQSRLSPEEKQHKTVVFVVCGGINVTYGEIGSYGDFLAEAEDEWNILCDGRQFRVT